MDKEIEDLAWELATPYERMLYEKTGLWQNGNGKQALQKLNKE